MHKLQEYSFREFIGYVNEAKKARKNLIENTVPGPINRSLLLNYHLATERLLLASQALVQLLGQNLGDIDQNTLINLINEAERSTTQ